MGGSCSTGQNPQWAVVPVEEEEEEQEEEEEDEEEEEVFYIANFVDVNEISSTETKNCTLCS
jgi:hypothetical protein